MYQNNLKNIAVFSRANDLIKKGKKVSHFISEKMNVTFNKNCENIGKILKISCVRCNVVKFDINFLGLL